ncbi:hypothetical protein [Aureimonas sp. N4]|uniref:hypothetical protein n=1 Tax=Aureimonas sp. N4 TaxID=1638165 RepID=UPI0012E3C280|nr:hypothetical protein [Aureimonas sp. N4]
MSGDKIESISPNDGRIVLSSDGTKLVRGLTATTDAPIKVEIVRSHPLAPNTPQRQTFTLMVAVPALAISGTPGTVRASYHFHFLPTVTGGSGDKSFTLTGKLPDGLSFSSQSGTIYGRPLTGGQSFSGSIGVSDGTGAASLPVSFTVAARGDGQTRLVNTVLGGLICNNVLPTSGSKTRFKGRRAYPFGLFTPPSIQPTFCPWWTNGTYAQREVAAAQDITITKASVVYNGVSVPVTYNGSRTFTIPAGVAEFSCDPIPPTAFGVSQFAPRSFVEYRHLFDLVAGQSAPYCDYSTDFNQSWRGTTSDLGDDVDATGPMTVSNTPDALNIFFPSMMLGVLPVGATSLGLLGDSIFRQQNDTGGLGRAGGGYTKRAAYAEGIPFVTMAVGGRTAEQTANSPKLLSLLEAGRFTDIHIGLGTNELAGSRDLSLIMADNRAIWASARKGGVRKIIQSNIQPRTTDNAFKCTDLANQVPVAGFEAGGRRDQFNTALAAERGVNGGPDVIFDFASYCADPVNPSLWRVPAFTATVTADVVAGATNVQMSAAPNSLDNLVFEPGNASNVDIGGQGGPRVASVSGSASPYTVSFVPSTTNPWNGSADGALGTPGKAHLAGTAVKATLGTDGTHAATGTHYPAGGDLRSIYRDLSSPQRGNIADVHSFNSRLAFNNGVIQASVAVLENSADIITMISPPWDCKCPRFWFGGFYGKTGTGETAVGNDVNYELALIEINDVKYTLPSGGSEAFVVPNGGFKGTDINEIKIPANSTVRVGWALNVAPGGSYPSTAGIRVPASVFATASGRGDAGSANATSRKSFLQTNTTGTAAATRDNAIVGAPVAITCLPDGAAAIAAAKSAVVLGDSIGWMQNDFQAGFGITSADFATQGYVNRGLSRPTKGRIPFTNLCVPGSRFRDLTLSGGGGEAGTAGFAMRKALLEAAGYPFSTRLVQMGINTVSNDAAALTLTKAAEAFAFVATLGGNGRKTLATTLTPQTVQLNDTNWTSANEASQTRASDGGHAAYDDWIMGRPFNVDGVIDVRPAFEGPAGARKWGVPANNSGTLSADVAVGANSMTLSFKPTEGDTLVIDAGISASVETFIVTTVSGSAAPFTVGRKGTFTKAHTTGAAVAGTYTSDGTHTSRQSSVAGAIFLDASKSLIV